MSVVYIVSSNGKLNKENQVLHYSDYKGNTTKILPDKVDQIVVVGAMEITGQALLLIMNKQINVTFFHKNGRYEGRLIYQDSKNTLLRHAQHQMLDNKEFTASLAKDIVRGKLHNQYLFLQRMSRKFPELRCFKEGIKAFSSIREELERTYVLEEIRGCEGMGAKIYFDLFGNNITAKWTSFSCRTKNPPLDPVNSVLSFIYTVLASRIERYINEEGLDSSVGSLHALTYGRKSLVFDLIEEFRTPIADTLTCSLFNMGVLSPSDFQIVSTSEINDPETEQTEQFVELEDAVLLTEEGMKKVLAQLERKLSDEHMYPLKDRLYTYDRILHEQVKQYKQVIAGFLTHYQPMVIT